MRQRDPTPERTGFDDLKVLFLPWRMDGTGEKAADILFQHDELRVFTIFIHPDGALERGW